MPGSIVEDKSGKLTSYYDADSGVITENVTGTRYDFYQEGAQVQFPVGSDIDYIRVTTPTGKIIIRDIRGKSGSN